MSRRVAISVRNRNGLESALDPRFGRAPAFVIADVESGGLVAEFDNDFAQEAQGAGTATAARISGERVDAVISGAFGPKAYEALNKLGIEMWLAPDTITAHEALARFALGILEPMKMKVY